MAVGVHREALYRRLRTLRTEAEAAYRGRHGAGGLQAPLERQVRMSGLPGAAVFEGKVASRWAPLRLDGFSTPRPDSFEQVLAVIAVWRSWTGTRTLEADGRVGRAWLASEDRGDWQRLLESAWQETVDARSSTQGATGVEAEADACVARYFERLVQTCGRLNLDVLGPGERAGEQPAIRLRQVFEAPPASWDPPKPELPARLWQELVERGEVPAEELPPGLRAEQIKAWRKSRVERPPVPVLEAVASPHGQRLVLLGDPGAGKSTLARYLALALAGGVEEVPAELRDLVEAGAVPVVVELRHLADGQRWQGRTVEDFWEQFNTTERMGLPRAVLEYLLGRTHRPVLVVFDGLDEIFDPARRAEVARQVAAFAEVHEHVRVILTSRVVGFTRGVFAAAGFSQAKLEDLPKRQVESFIRRWYAAAHPDDPGEAARLSERLISAVRGFPSVAELAGNPLLLTILASIGLGATIPRDRREVYRHAVDVLTGRWDRDAKHLPLPRQDHPDVAAAIDELDTGLLQEILERLARRLQESAGNDRGSPLISRDDLTDMIAEYVVTDMNYPHHVGRIVANAMVGRLHERAFLLHPYGAGMYGFVHRTFLEYLAARELSRRYTGREWTPEQLIDMLAERAVNPVWHEVILLFIGQISRQAEAEHATFIARLLHMHRRRGTSPYRQADDSTTFLELAIRVLAEAHRLPRAPSQPGDHPERSLAIQSNAVIDSLTAHLSRHPWVQLNGAVPALMSFPWSWDGRARYQRWHRAGAAPDTGEATRAVLAASLCRTPQEASLLVQAPWGDRTAVAALQVLGERWADREDAYNTVLETARNADPDSRHAALRVLGEHWHDREDAYDTVLDAARNPGTHSQGVALRVLGEHWHDREDVYNIVFNAARDAMGEDTSHAALQALGEHWHEREDAYSTVLDTASDPDTNTFVRDTALRLLGTYWADREEAYNTILDNARAPGSTSADVAMRMLGEHWADREDAYNTVLDNARDATNDLAHHAALQVLGQLWPEREDAFKAVLDNARNPNATDFARYLSVQALAEYWADHEDAYNTVLNAARISKNEFARYGDLWALGTYWAHREGAYNAILDIVRSPEIALAGRGTALRVLGERWPEREDAYSAILHVARSPEIASADRGTALHVLGERWPEREDAYNAILDAARNCDLSAALDVLGERWPDLEDTYNAVLNAARHPNSDSLSVAVQALGERWPDRQDTYNAVLNAACDPLTSDATREVALRVLAQRWPEREDAWNCAIRSAAEARGEMRDSLVHLLALVWPERRETEELLVKLADENPDDAVARALSYIREMKQTERPASL